MVEVIPAIIAKDFDELEQKIRKVAPYTDWAQIDVSDGIFTPNTTWNNPRDLQKLPDNIALEIHLMISNPENHIADWIDSNAKRIIVHVGGNDDYQKIAAMAEMVKSNNVEFAIALNPEVPVASVQKIIPLADAVILLAVNPGFSGEEFQPAVLEKIKDLRKLFGDVSIEVDGGINLQTARQCVAAGADVLISASYVFDSENIQEAIATLKEIQ